MFAYSIFMQRVSELPVTNFNFAIAIIFTSISLYHCIAQLLSLLLYLCIFTFLVTLHRMVCSVPGASHSLEQLSNTSSKFQPRCCSWSVSFTFIGPAARAPASTTVHLLLIVSRTNAWWLMEHSRCLNQVSETLVFVHFLILYFQ